VDTHRYRPDEQKRVETRRQLGIGDEFVWLAVGRLMWKKGHRTLLRAFAATEPGLLLIAGTGPDEPTLRTLANELGTNVRFLGPRKDVADLMGAADAFVLSSVVEGMPTVLLEALSSGLPCVATDVGGVAEIIRADRNGYLVPAGDPDSLGAAMTRLAAQPPEVRHEMGRAARERAVAEFDREVVVGQWEQLYRELLEVSFS
jgi:glycosyltransferase involved in cell wall biosynthesis